MWETKDPRRWLFGETNVLKELGKKASRDPTASGVEDVMKRRQELAFPPGELY